MATLESDYNLLTTIKLRPVSLFGGGVTMFLISARPLAIVGD